MGPEPIPLTVVGGYLGAGKTTLVNHVLQHPGGRRIGVIVNDFGSLAVDAGLLADAGADDVISLPNGCVCCTVGAGLHEALAAITDRSDPPDHVVVEVSGVADPAVAAAWGTVPPFQPAGVVVLADATSIERLARDRYVGVEIRRQLAGADIVLLTKVDLCGEPSLGAVEEWLADASGGAPSVRVVAGRVPTDLVLGGRSELRRAARSDGRLGVHTHEVAAEAVAGIGHADRYVTWTWVSERPVERATLDRFVEALPATVLRVKGTVGLDDGSAIVVQVVGRRVDIRPVDRPDTYGLVAIARRTDPATPSPFAPHLG